jgi:hypothetical protein
MAERTSRVVSMRVPLDEYEMLHARANAENRTIGSLALDLLRQAARPQRPVVVRATKAEFDVRAASTASQSAQYPLP